MIKRILAKSKKNGPRQSDRRCRARKASALPEEHLNDRGERGTKYAVYAVFIQECDGREDFRVYSEQLFALKRYTQAAMAGARNKPLRNGNQLFFKIAGAWLYKVECDDMATARRSVIEGRAELIAGPEGLLDSIIDDLFEPQH